MLSDLNSQSHPENHFIQVNWMALHLWYAEDISVVWTSNIYAEWCLSKLVRCCATGICRQNFCNVGMGEELQYVGWQGLLT